MPEVTIIRSQPVIPPVSEVVLTLTPDEAVYLREALGDRVTQDGSRGIFWALDSAMKDAGLIQKTCWDA